MGWTRNSRNALVKIVSAKSGIRLAPEGRHRRLRTSEGVARCRAF
jgi:hypothetical protein